jgi:hypothetical protein
VIEANRSAWPVNRMVAVLVTGSVRAAAPPGVDPAAFGRALVEDTCDVVAGLEMVVPAVAVSRAGEAALGGCPVEELIWPGTPVIRLGGPAEPPAGPPPEPAPPPGPPPEPASPGVSPSGLVAQTLDALAGLGASQAAVLAADTPDLPPLLIGKLFRALGAGRRAGVAVCPADGGGLVALASWLPAPGWLAGVVPAPGAAELDLGDIAERLRTAAPSRGTVRSGPGWHRMRSPSDARRLDPGLEGWEATRELLSERHDRP